MSYASQKGYAAEHAVVQVLTAAGNHCYRPRTTSHANADTGDVAGLPLIISIKNHARLDLATWTDELSTMVTRQAQWDAGVVIHKRKGKGQPRDWYVTTTVGLFLPLLAGFIDHIERDSHGL